MHSTPGLRRYKVLTPPERPKTTDTCHGDPQCMEISRTSQHKALRAAGLFLARVGGPGERMTLGQRRRRPVMNRESLSSKRKLPQAILARCVHCEQHESPRDGRSRHGQRDSGKQPHLSACHFHIFYKKKQAFPNPSGKRTARHPIIWQRCLHQNATTCHPGRCFRVPAWSTDDTEHKCVALARRNEVYVRKTVLVNVME